MTAPRHTAGPWSVRTFAPLGDEKCGQFAVMGKTPHPSVFVCCGELDPRHGDGAANAALLAAAPDLLEAARAARDLILSYMPRMASAPAALVRLNAAIESAEGR